jgi:hypothetical protein
LLRSAPVSAMSATSPLPRSARRPMQGSSLRSAGLGRARSEPRPDLQAESEGWCHRADRVGLDAAPEPQRTKFHLQRPRLVRSIAGAKHRVVRSVLWPSIGSLLLSGRGGPGGWVHRDNEQASVRGNRQHYLAPRRRCASYNRPEDRCCPCCAGSATRQSAPCVHRCIPGLRLHSGTFVTCVSCY